MSIGYACLAVAVPGSDIRSCNLKNANEERLLSLIGHNLSSLETLTDYNTRNGIKLFRISSDLVPFGSSVSEKLPWEDVFADQIAAIGSKICDAGVRVSMHPGQYTVLNSPDSSVAERAIKDLNYHARVLDAMKLGPEHKIVLHMGGVYGDKNQAKSRFLAHFRHLQSEVRNRLVLENDDSMYNISDVLETAAAAGIPAVYDNLHNAVNPTDRSISDHELIRLCSSSWGPADGFQKIHYSQQNPEKRKGAHSDTIGIDAFLDFYDRLPTKNIDIMLEVKDKNISALKCINCVSNRGIAAIEVEWARYKYYILERSPAIYQKIRQLLNEKHQYPSVEMYRMIESTSDMAVVKGNAANAAQHVWGYFNNKVTENEKKRFEQLLKRYISGETALKSLKNNLLLLAEKYDERYLLDGYYLYK